MGNGTSSKSAYPPASIILSDSPTTPKYLEPPTYDPHYGFASAGAERKERVMKATEAELFSAKVPPGSRDYCAHHFINYMACKQDKFPFVYRCAPQRHHYEECQYEDYILRMKEFERERRLLERQEKKKRMEIAAH